jgi:hypothetical protein
MTALKDKPTVSKTTSTKAAAPAKAPAPVVKPEPAKPALAAVATPILVSPVAKPAAPQQHRTPPLPLSGGSVLRDNFERANALASGACVHEQTVTLPLHLRMVRWKGGFLIGLIDGRKSTYAECEFFEDEKLADTAWKEWLVACKA